MAVGEIILTAFITVLFEKLASPELLNFLSREGIDTQLKKWSKTLKKIQAVLNDAEEKQITNEAVQEWLDDLQDLAYDLDDLLDEFNYEALRSKLDQASTSTSLIPTWCTSFAPTAIWFNSKMRSKIDDITSRFEYISATKTDLDLKESPTRPIDVRERILPTTCMPPSHVYGREKDKESILEQLLTDDDGLIIIPIQGMGGVGKTTLAQQIYDGDKVKSWFDTRAWACVSDDFDIVRVTKTILESFTRKSYDFKDLNMLHVELNEKLSGKKFLLVLDDLWNDNYQEWDLLLRPFSVGAAGSRIIVTTRNRSVASITGSLPSSTYHLKELSSDHCLHLFAQHALGRENFVEHPNLKEMGEEIVKRCKGLPLAAKTLGGLLRTKLEQSDWEDILKSKIWDLPQQNGAILPALHLSYHHLPSHLKRCFVYCSIFSKDYEFDKDKLVLLWMAEGFLKPSEGKKRLMDFGRKCFEDLLSRSFFQQSSSNTEMFVMHDLLNDLAEYVARRICFRLDNDGQHEFSERARHSSFTRQKYEVAQKFKPFHKVQRLRTFLPLSYHKYWRGYSYYVSSKVLDDLLPKLQCLRVLSLCSYSITELPDSIGNLKHLRYLDLSETDIKWLPEKVSTLYNLQTLLLSRCHNLCKLPSKIGNLINLQCLDIAKTPKLKVMPSEICKLTSLQTLSKIVLDRDNGLRLGELKDLSLLCGKLSIVGLQNVMDISDAEAANLKSKRMDGLLMEWSSNFVDCQNSQLEMDLLDKLCPHQCLKSLEINFYWGMEFPSWIGDPSFSHITKLSLIDCRKCTSLPTLGQLPLLKNLYIQGMHKVKRVGEEFCKFNSTCSSLEFPFPALETLSFQDMPEWEEWLSFDSIPQFHRLRELGICKCPKLNRVSLLTLPTLLDLYLQECGKVMLRSVCGLGSLIKLTIESMSDLTCLPKEFMEELVALQYMYVKNCQEFATLWENGVEQENLVCLLELDVVKCPKLVSLVGEEEQRLPRNLRRLIVRDCANLEKIPNVFKRLTSLSPSMMGGRLEISALKALESLPDGNARLESLGIIGFSNLHIYVERPTLLEKNLEDSSVALSILSINDVQQLNIGTLLGTVQNTTFANLVSLSIEGYDGVESFRETSFSTTTPNLRRLYIKWCKNLKKLLLCDQIHDSLTSLERLEVSHCSSLDSFTQRDLPPSLRVLNISSCKNLKKLLCDQIHDSLTSLERLEVSHCPSLDSFTQTDLPPNLRELTIRSCKNLKKLLLCDQIHDSLTSLEHLEISDCPSLDSFTQTDLPPNLRVLEISYCPSLDSFPQTDLPPNLRVVSISNCKKLRPLSEWGLHRLTSLQTFDINDPYPELVSFPFLLSATLTTLEIGNLSNLKSLSSLSHQNLNSLRKLNVWRCPELCSLPQEDLLLTLLHLEIVRCPLLTQRCLKDEGDYWPQISHIPRLLIDRYE